MTITQPTPASKQEVVTPWIDTTSEQKETSTAKFSITLLPIGSKEDPLSYISNLSLTRNLGITNLKKLWLNPNSYDYCGGQIFTKYLKLWTNLKKNGYATDSWINADNLLNSNVIFFQAKEIKENTWTFIITTTDNMTFFGDAEEYLKNGLISLTLWNYSQINKHLQKERYKQSYDFQKPLLYIRTPKQVLNIWADDYCITSEDQKQFCVLEKNQITLHEYTDDAVNTISDTYDLSNYGIIKNIRTDSNNNFYFIIAKQDGKSQLKVLNRNTLEEVMSFPDLTEIVYLSNEQGKLFCMDKDGYLRLITVNVKQLPRGYVDSNSLNVEMTKQNIIKIEDKSRRDLQEAINKGLTLDLNDTTSPITNEDHANDESLRKKLRNTKVQVSTPLDKEEKTNNDGLPLSGEMSEAWAIANGEGQRGWAGVSLKHLFTQAKTLPEINRVYALAQQLKMNPKVIAVKGLIDPILQEISEKKEKIRLEASTTNLATIVETLKTATVFSDFLIIKQQLIDIKRERSQTLLPDKAFDTLLKETTQIIEEKIKEYQTEHQEDIKQQLEENFIELKNELSNIDYLPHINTILKHPLRIETEQLINYLSEEEKKTMKDHLTNLKKQRQNELKALAQNESKAKQQQQQEKVLSIQNAINDIKDIILSINDEDTLEQIEKTDTLVLQTKADIEELPGAKAQELSIKLEQLFKERALSIKFSKEESKGSLKTLDQYGIPKTLYFVPEIKRQVKRDIYGKPLGDGKYKLQFRSSVGNVIEPNINKRVLWNYKFIYTLEEREALKKSIHERNTNGNKKKYHDLLKEYQALPTGEWKSRSEIKEERKSWSKINEFQEIEKEYYIPRMLEVMKKITGENKLRNIHQRKNLPHIDQKTVITPSIEKKLAEWGNTLWQQLVNRQGYMVIESDSGTGKNFKIDILGHLTNREIFDISCNVHMEKEDLLFSQEINTDGTYRQPSELIRGIQTPGAIILLDEVNTLKPGVAKLLNPLLDGRRYINDPQLWKVHVHPSVVISGAMNPQDYLGTSPLPQEQISRARIVNDDYQPAEEEAFMISRHLDGALSKLSWEEFQTYRKQYNIGDQKPSGNKSVYHLFKDLKKVVDTAKKLRKAYSDTKRGKADIWAELDRLFSPRESIQIIQDYNFTKDITQSIYNIVLPKIADFEQREYAKTLIAQTLE